MEQTKKISKLVKKSEKWLKAAKLIIDEAPEPAAFNALHSLELISKAALLAKTGNTYKTHNIGGIFGKNFRNEIGRKKM